MVIVCPNLSDKNVAKEFNELVQAVGEDAAYQIWSLNNGNGIEMAPNGRPSLLFQQLLEKHSLQDKRNQLDKQIADLEQSILDNKAPENVSDRIKQLKNQREATFADERLAAIKDKAMTFADNYTKLDTDENGEVLLKDLYSGIQQQPNKETPLQYDRLINDYSGYVRQRVMSYIQNNQNADNPDIINEERSAAIDWATQKQTQIIGDTQKKLIEAFGMQLEDGKFVIKDDSSEIARLRVQFVNGIIEHGYIDTYKQNEIDHYIISIGLFNGDATTFNHELAHYYIRRFKDSKLVQTALDEYAKKGMSIDQIEEALVDAITERSVQNQWGSNLENQSFFHKFWYGFNNMLYKVFNIKTQAHRDYISDQITKSFMVNRQLDQTENDSKYVLSYNRMYQSQYRSRMQEKTTQSYRPMLNDNVDMITSSIVNSTRSKEKAYKQRLRRGSVSTSYNIEQSARNQEMSRIVEEYREQIENAKKNKDVEYQRRQVAYMFLDFLKNADVEITEMRAMMMNARANDYRKVFYKNNPNGTISYTRSSDDELFTESNREDDVMSHDYTFDDLEYAKTDIVGFFAPIISAISNNLQSMEAQGYDKDLIDEIREFLQQKNLVSRVYDIEFIWEDALEKKVLDTIDQIVEERVDLDSDRKTRLRINMHKWLRDQMDYGDVKSAEIVVGMGSRSKSPLIRAVQDIIYQMEDEKGDKTYQKAMELMDLKRKAEKSMGLKYKFFYNVQKLLMQMDENGLPTGYLLSKINTAQYYRDREKFRDNLLFGTSKDSSWQFNQKSIEQQVKDLRDATGKPIVKDDWELSIDDEGGLILPDHPMCENIYKNYLREYESWVCDHVERPYTKKYYLDRIDTLSMTTLQALNRINDKINSITQTCIVEGRPRYNLLSEDQIQNLISLEEERSELSNFYDLDNNIKTGDDFIIAKDLMMWNRKTSGKISYVTDTSLYEQCKNDAKDSNHFERTFSSVKINPEIWDLIKKTKTSNIPQTDPDYQELMTLYYQKSKLTNRYKGEKIGQVKWDSLFDESTGRLKSVQFWKTLKYMDDRIDALQETLFARYGKAQQNDDAFTFAMALKNDLIPYNYLRRLNVDWADPNEKSQYQTMIDALTDAYRNAATEEQRQEIVSEAQLLSKWNSALGRSIPADIFFAIRPIKNEFTYKGQTYKSLVRQPNSLFQVVDREKSKSEYVNKDYVESPDGFVQPKESLYRDKRWDVVENNPALLALHTKLKEVMQESWRNLPISSKYDGRLSQMGARTCEILGRNAKKQFGKNIAEFLRREFTVVETDLEFRPIDDREKRPDGSDIENIPIRFLRKLDNPEYISSDLIWSTVCFYDMSLNFKTKMDHVSELISIYRRLDQNQISDEYKSLFDARQAEVVKGMLDRQVYDKQVTVAKSANQLLNQTTLSDKELITKGPGWLKKVGGTSKDWLKRVGKLRISLQLGMLALNLPSAIVSFLDPFLSLTIDCVTGKYINAKDVAFALKEMVKDFPMAVFGTGNIRAYCKSIAGMQKMQLSRRVPDTVRKSNVTPVVRFLTDGPLMKGFTLGDYTMNTINMISTMHNYRYYKDQNGTAAFYPKHIFIQKVMQDLKCNVRVARSKYNSAVNMYSCYKVDDKGEFVADLNGIHKEEAKAISTKVELDVKKQTRSRSAIYNGLVPNGERTLLQTNVVLAFFSMLRNFIITGIWERFQTYRDFQVSTFDEEGNPVLREGTPEERQAARKNQNYYKGGYSFATRQVENAVLWSACYGFRHAFANLKYAMMIAKSTKADVKYSEAGQRWMKKNNINEQDAYGMQKVFMECLCWMILLGIGTFTQRAADDDKNSYMIQLMNLMALRLSTERYTWYSPETAMELIKSPTTALSDWQRKMKIAALGEDLVTYVSNLLSLTDGGAYNDTVKRGYYKGSPRWKRDLFSVLSSTGLHNWHKSMPEVLGGSGAQGVKETSNFYKSLRPDWYGWAEDKLFKDDDGNWTEW